MTAKRRRCALASRNGASLPSGLGRSQRGLIPVSLFVVGEAADEIDDGAPRLDVGDAHKRLVQLKAVAAAQELDDGVLGRLLRKPVGHELVASPEGASS